MNTAQQPQTATTNNRRDLHQQVTDTIIRQLEKGTIPWHQPWINKGPDRLLDIPRNYTTGKKYRGVNILLLWTSALNAGYSTAEWGSFKQWQEQKEFVRKGEKGTMIIYYDKLEREVDGEVKEIPFIKSSVVFNRCQLASFTEAEPVAEDNTPLTNLVQRIEHVHRFVDNTHAVVECKNSDPGYRHDLDTIIMPYPELFIDTPTCTATEGYYAALMHELTHWTANPKRLNRNMGKKYGDQEYAVEELVAEMGAAFLCAEMGISLVEKGDHAGYIDFWLDILRQNKHCLFSAASEASKAVDYLQSLQPA